MNSEVRDSILAVLGSQGRVVGAAFFCGNLRTVISCFHVIKLAMSDRGEVFLRTAANGTVVRGVVDRYLDVDSGDLCVLRTEVNMEGCIALQLSASQPALNQQLITYGFPEAFEESGLPSSAQYIGVHEFEGAPALTIRSSQITRGFSGAPIVDPQSGLVVGVVAAIANPDRHGRLIDTSLCIPVNFILKHFPLFDPKTDPRIDSYARSISAGMNSPAYDFDLKFSQSMRPSEKLFVEPRFVSRVANGMDGIINYKAVFANTIDIGRDLLVITGPPGSGKSTLLRHWAANSWTKPESIGLDRPHAPIYVRLRTLAGTVGLDLVERLRSALKSDKLFVLPSGMGAEIVDFLLQSEDFPVLILLDGYDEIDNFVDRNQIRTILQELRLIKHLRIVVTCRVGTDLNNLACPFCHYEIAPLAEDQVQKYFEHWTMDMHDSLLKDSMSPDEYEQIISNPLLLSLSLYLLDNGTPQVIWSRTKLYEQIICLWLNEWRRRGFDCEVGKDVAHLAPVTLGKLAFTGLHGQADLNLRQAKESVSEHLAHSLAAPKAIAQRLSSAFVKFLGDHSGIISFHNETMFWKHRTYQDYLAAVYMGEEANEKKGKEEYFLRMWRTNSLRNALIFFIALQPSASKFNYIKNKIADHSGGLMFVADCMRCGVGFSDQEIVTFSAKLREAVKAELSQDPRTMCERALAFQGGAEHLDCLMALAHVDIVLEAICELLSDPTVYLVLRQDILRHLLSKGVEPKLRIFMRLNPRRRDAWHELVIMNEVNSRNAAAVRSYVEKHPWAQPMFMPQSSEKPE